MPTRILSPRANGRTWRHRIHAVIGGGEREASNIVETVPALVVTLIDKAQGRPTWASSTEAGRTDLGPEKAVDGNPTATRYGSAFVPDAQWMVDLESVRSIHEIELVWQMSYARRWTLYYSTQSAAWQTPAHPSWQPVSVDEFTEAAGLFGHPSKRQFNPVQGRYWMIRMADRETPQYGFSFFEVYLRGVTVDPPWEDPGTPADTTPPDAPTWPVSGSITAGILSVTLNWDASPESDLHALPYLVERRRSDDTGAWTPGAWQAAPTATLTLPVESWDFRVKARDASGNVSAVSTTKTATPIADPGGDPGDPYEQTGSIVVRMGGKWVPIAGATTLDTVHASPDEVVRRSTITGDSQPRLLMRADGRIHAERGDRVPGTSPPSFWSLRRRPGEDGLVISALAEATARKLLRLVDAAGAETFTVDDTGVIEMAEQAADPAAPATGTARLFCRDNGSGKTQVCVRFPTGAIQVLSTEP